MSRPTPPKHIAVVLFPGFQLLDLAGPLDALNLLATMTPLKLSLLARTLSPVSTLTSAHLEAGSSFFSESLVPTHTFADPPPDIEVLIVPGGVGSRSGEDVDEVEKFLTIWVERVRWCLTVCTGSEILARTGFLKGRRATTNKRRFNTVKKLHPDVEWVAKARWVTDGQIWTSSGISAGMDLIYAWIEEIWGKVQADFLADAAEYERNRDSEQDRFAVRWGAT